MREIFPPPGSEKICICNKLFLVLGAVGIWGSGLGSLGLWVVPCFVGGPSSKSRWDTEEVRSEWRPKGGSRGSTDKSR